MRLLRIGIVGAPYSGKEDLINQLVKALKKHYQVIVLDNPAIKLIKMGLNLNTLDFQLKCLDEYKDMYEKLDSFMPLYSQDKNIVIIYNTLPDMGECYLAKKHSGYDKWRKRYLSYKEIFTKHAPNIVYLTEILTNTDFEQHQLFARDLSPAKILSIEEKLYNKYKNSSILQNVLISEEKLNIILEDIEKYFSSIPLTWAKYSYIQQSCSVCGWQGSVEIDKLYNFCPSCGLLLVKTMPLDSSTPGGSSDPLGIEQRNKMFYVDPSKLPIYTSRI